MNGSMKSKTRLGLLTLGLCALVAAGGCSSSQKQGNSQKQEKSASLDASWATEYQSLASLKSNADVAVLGTFTKVMQQTIDKNNIPYTDFQFSVKRQLFKLGSKQSVANGAALSVHQTGGTVDGVLMQVDDDPLFKVGDSAILFLHQYAPGMYYVIGGPTGRFKVANDQVSPINSEGVKFSGSLATFEDQ